MTNPYDDTPPTAIQLPALDDQLYVTVNDWVRRKQEAEEIFADLLEPVQQPVELPPLAPEAEPVSETSFITEAQLTLPDPDNAVYVIHGERLKRQDRGS